MGNNRLSLAIGLCCLTSVAAGQPGSDSAAATDLADAQVAAPEHPALTEQQRYEQQVREAEAARREYEEGLRRRQEETERAAAEYQLRLREYEADPAVQRARANTCAAQYAVHHERAGRVGRYLGRIAGGIAGESAGTRFENWVVRVGSQVGERLANLLDCAEQMQVAAATEEALAGGVGTTSTWVSETRPGVTGSSTVTAAEERDDGGTCMTVTDIVIVDGEENRAPKQMCRMPPSNRFVRV